MSVFERDVFDRITDRAYALDADYRFTRINTAASHHFTIDGASAIGRTILEMVPSFVGSHHERILRRVMATREEETHRLDSTLRPGRRMAVTVFPHRDGLGVVFEDITEQRLAIAELDAAGEKLRAQATANAAQLAELQAIYDTAPIGLCVIDKDRRFVRVNRRLAEMNGVPVEQHIGRTVAQVLPHLVDDAEPLFQRVLEQGETLHGVEITGETPAQPGRTRVWREYWRPLRDANGAVTGVNIAVEDITEVRAAADRERLLMRELDHRAKNVLAVVSALVRLTAKGDPAHFIPSLEGRISALGRAHRLLASEHWQRLSLPRLLHEELSPHADGVRLSLEGPTLPLTAAAAQSLAMALHELATNAAKYGSLSVPDGRLAVAWRRDAERLVIDWVEDGVEVTTPDETGFGFLLIRSTIEGQLRGTLALRWLPDGLACQMTLPASVVANPETEEAEIISS